MVLVPEFVPQAFISMYLPAIYAGLIVGFIGSIAIAMKKEEIHILILTDLIGLAMVFLRILLQMLRLTLKLLQ